MTNDILCREISESQRDFVEKWTGKLKYMVESTHSALL